MRGMRSNRLLRLRREVVGRHLEGGVVGKRVGDMLARDLGPVIPWIAGHALGRIEGIAALIPNSYDATSALVQEVLVRKVDATDINNADQHILTNRSDRAELAAGIAVIEALQPLPTFVYLLQIDVRGLLLMRSHHLGIWLLERFRQFNRTHRGIVVEL